jgi:hypothetical protein
MLVRERRALLGYVTARKAGHGVRESCVFGGQYGYGLTMGKARMGYDRADVAESKLASTVRRGRWKLLRQGTVSVRQMVADALCDMGMPEQGQHVAWVAEIPDVSGLPHFHPQWELDRGRLQPNGVSLEAYWPEQGQPTGSAMVQMGSNVWRH